MIGAGPLLDCQAELAAILQVAGISVLEVVSERIQFLGPRKGAGNAAGAEMGDTGGESAPPEAEPAGRSGGADDIPF